MSGGSAAGLEAVGGEGEGNGFVIGFPSSTRPASGGCGGSRRFANAADLFIDRGHTFWKFVGQNHTDGRAKGMTIRKSQAKMIPKASPN